MLAPPVHASSFQNVSQQQCFITNSYASQNLHQDLVMGFILYSLTFAFLVLATGRLSVPFTSSLSLTMTALYITRDRWRHLVPIPDYIYHRLPSSFSNDIESGFSSSDFDLSANVAVGDSRGGLDQAAKAEIQKIMKSRRVGFDEARRMYTERRFERNGIGVDGRPRDPKFVSFS